MVSKKTYRFLDCRLDAGHRIIEREGELLPMPPKVVDTLIVLVENAGEVVDKETFFKTVWPGTTVVESSLTRNISLLRKTLSKSGNGEAIIQTVSKRGYRFLPAVEEVDEGEIVGAATVPNQPAVIIRSGAGRRIFIISAGGATAAAILGAVLTRGSRPSIRPQVLTDADREYLIGRHFWNKIEPAEVERALQRFHKAAELDPKSAIAYAGIADSHILMVSLGMTNRANSLREAKAAAERAIALDPNLALPHVSLGYVAAMGQLDLETARRQFEHALQLGPTSMQALPGYGDYLTWIGDLQGARTYFERAKQSQPLSAILGTRAARLEYFDHRYAQAVDLLKEVLEREPLFASARYYLALSYAFLGRTEAALAELHLTHLNPNLLAADEAWVRAMSGDNSAARALLEQRRKEVDLRQKRPTVLLLAAIYSGERDLAIWVLEEMWKTREPELLHLKVDPRLDPLRSSPRFQDLSKRYFTSRG